jgi:peptide/nickel transport system permease protein
MRPLARIVAIVLLSGVACALLARFAPGSTVDERELNQKAGEDSIAALRTHKEISLAAQFAHYLRGDLGYSESNNAPIRALIADRAPATLRELAIGLGGGWLIGFLFAIPRGRGYDAASAAGAGLLLSLPAALIAYLCVLLDAAPAIVLIAVIAPRIFEFAKNLLREAYRAPHIDTARARGTGELRIFLAHTLPSAAPQLIALAAASVSIAIGAAIPVEAICDVPGLGRLAWQAATARDLPLLVNLTMLVALATSGAAMVAEFATRKS